MELNLDEETYIEVRFYKETGTDEKKYTDTISGLVLTEDNEHLKDLCDWYYLELMEKKNDH